VRQPLAEPGPSARISFRAHRCGSLAPAPPECCQPIQTSAHADRCFRREVVCCPTVMRLFEGDRRSRPITALAAVHGYFEEF